MAMRTSAEGVKRIMQREGMRLHAYRDDVGVITIGVGHVDNTLRMGMVWTEQQVMDTLARDLARFEACVNTVIARPMKQHQFDAFVSVAFNIGTGIVLKREGGFAGSTMVKEFNAGDIEATAEAFMMWKKPASIIGRRKTEVAQFLTPYKDEPAAPAAAPAPKPAAPSVPQTPKEPPKPVAKPAPAAPAQAPPAWAGALAPVAPPVAPKPAPAPAKPTAPHDAPTGSGGVVV